MSHLNLIMRLGSVLALAVLGACSSYQPTAPQGQWSDGDGVRVDLPVNAGVQEHPVAPRTPAAPAPYRLRAGDVIALRIDHLQPVEEPRLVLGNTGRVTLPYLGAVEAAGVDIDTLRTRLAPRYAEVFPSAPVSLSIVERDEPTCAVLGQVGQPGEIPITGGASLVEVVARAGGFTYLDRRDALGASDLGRAFVARGEGIVPVDFEALFTRGDLSQDIVMQEGDLVMVPDNTHREVVVLGAVNKPQVVPMAVGSINVLSAIGHAGGFHRHADMTKVAVVRNVTSTRPIVRVIDLELALDAREPDLRLENGDVVFVARDDLAALELPEILKSAAGGLITAIGAARAAGN